MKIPPCLLHVASDLFAQCFHRRKLDLIAYASEKTDLDFALRRQLYGMKVQQVGFDGEGFCSKGWTIAYVCHGIKALGCHARPTDVDAVLGDELFIAREIDGWHSVFRAQAAPAPGSA